MELFKTKSSSFILSEDKTFVRLNIFGNPPKGEFGETVFPQLLSKIKELRGQYPYLKSYIVDISQFGSISLDEIKKGRDVTIAIFELGITKMAIKMPTGAFARAVLGLFLDLGMPKNVTIRVFKIDEEIMSWFRNKL